MRSKGQQKCWKKGHFVRFLRYSFLVLSVTVVIALSLDKKVTSDGIFGGKKGSVSGWGLDLRKCLLYAQIPGKNFPTITWFYGLRVVLSTEKMSFHENHVFPSFPYLSNFPRQQANAFHLMMHWACAPATLNNIKMGFSGSFSLLQLYKITWKTI